MYIARTFTADQKPNRSVAIVVAPRPHPGMPKEHFVHFADLGILGKKSKRLLYEAEPMYEILRDYIFGPAKSFDDDDIMGPREIFGNHFLARDLLVALNLLRPGKGGDWVTSELHELFCSGCRFKRKERIRRRRLRNAQKGLPVTRQ
jgi:hypothetical protein